MSQVYHILSLDPKVLRLNLNRIFTNHLSLFAQYLNQILTIPRYFPTRKKIVYANVSFPCSKIMAEVCQRDSVSMSEVIE
jgi:hypothetical protein